MRAAFDIWYSDGNDRHCIGVLGIDDPSVDNADDLAWKALEKALKAHAKNPDDWDMPYADPCAVYSGHATPCECECHSEDGTEADSDSGCEDCTFTESISVEHCDDPESDYYHHSRVTLDALLSEDAP